MENNIYETLKKVFDSLLELDDEAVEHSLESLKRAFAAELNSTTTKNTIQAQIKWYKERNYNKLEIADEIENDKAALLEVIIECKNETNSAAKQELYDIFYSYIESLYDMIFAAYNEESPQIQFEFCHPNAKLPTYAHPGDAGADVYAVEDTLLPAGSAGTIIPTGLKPLIPEGWMISVRPRSGMSVKTSIRVSNAPGTIDSSYRSPIGIILDNIGFKDYTIHAGDRIAQFVIERSTQATFSKCDSVEEGSAGDRGGGFGSTGV